MTINARDLVSLLNGANIYTFAISTNSRGNNGGISITTGGTLSITNYSELNTSTSGMGNAGDVTINARDRVSFNHGEIITSANNTATGNGGDVSITSGDISLANGSLIILYTTGRGNAGNFSINTDTLSLTNGAEVFASSNGQGTAASFTINASDRVSLDGRGSGVSIFNSQNSIGNNGGISIKTGTLSITNGAQLYASSLRIVILNQEDVSRVSVMPTTVDVSNRLITPSCTVFNDSGGSSFTVTGRGGLPPSPDESLTSDAVWTDTRLPVTTAQHQHKTHVAKSKPQPIAIIPATGWVVNDKGEVTLISSVSNPTSMNTPTNCPTR